jgi:dimethylamine monooxygenase subunit A
MTSVPPWLDELSLRPGPPWLSMGTHSLDLARWLIVDDRRDDELALKTQLLGSRPSDVIATLPGSEEASAEANGLVREWLGRHDVVVATRSPDRHPLDDAGRLVQEDLCVMERHGGGWILTAASVCFPSHWRIADKIGRHVTAIHAPVAHYDDELSAKVDRFFDRLRVDRPVWRRNLSIHNHAELFSPGPHESSASFGHDIEGIWLRSEYQTLRSLELSGAILFTIRTQLCAAAVLTERPDVAHALAAKLLALGSELTQLGRPSPFPDWLPQWLEHR